MQVSLPALKAFESAARLGSFKAAAAELSITPTAVSHHINKLEHRLNVTLFTRAARKVTLTELGKELSAATSEGFHTIQAAIDDITANDMQINVATTSSFASLILIPALQTFYTQYPEVQINVISGESVDSDNYTVPIRLGEASKQSKADIIKIESFNLYNGPKTSAPFNEQNQITVYTTKWKNNDLPPVPLQAWLEKNGVQQHQVHVHYFDQELFGIQQALLDGDYVFCSDTLVQSYLNAGVLAKPNAHPVQSQLCYYIENKNQRTNRHNAMFVSWLEELLN